MTGVSLGLRTGSYGSLQQPVAHTQNGALPTHVLVVRKPKLSLGGSREKERFIFCMFRYLSRKKVGMLLLVLIALLAFMSGIFTVNREDVSDGNSVILFTELYNASFLPIGVHQRVMNSSMLVNNLVVCEGNPHTFNSFIAGFDRSSVIDQDNPCDHFAFPPPPPGYRR